MPYNRGDISISESIHQCKSISHAIQKRVGRKVIVEGDIGSGTAPIASEIWSDDVKPSAGKR